MTISKTWNISTLQRQTVDGYVDKAIFFVDATDGTYKARITGEVSLAKPETLVPYADLTKSTVINWVKTELNSQKDDEGNSIDNVSAIEAALETQINEQKAPSIATGTPWT